MWTQLQNLSKLRKLHLAYSLLVAGCNVFLIAVTVVLIVKYFGDLGIIIRDYSIPIFGLLLFLPKISQYIADNPFKCYPYIVTIEIGAVVGYMAVAQGIPHAVPVLLFSMFMLGSSNTLVRPLRAANASLVVAGDKEYAVLAERFSSITLVIITGIGIAMTTYEVNTMVNAVLSITFMALSRWVYHHFLMELQWEKLERGELKCSENSAN